MSVKEYFEYLKKPRMKEIESGVDRYGDIMQLLSDMRFDLHLKSPFLSYLTNQLPLIVTRDKRLNSIACDLRFIYIGYDYIINILDMNRNDKKAAKAKIEGTIAHQMMHFIMKHYDRFIQGGYNKETWKEATEIVTAFAIEETMDNINRHHKLAKWDNVDTSTFREYEGKTADFIYRKLLEDKPSNQGQGQGDDQDQNQQGDGESDCDCDAELISELIRQSPLEEGEEEGQMNDSWEQEYSRDTERNDGAISNALSKGIGNLPSDLVAEILNDLKPKVDWRTRLMRHVQPMIVSDYQYNPPHKQYLIHDIIYPSMKKTGISIMVGVDTSASVSDHELNQFAAELRGLLKSVQNLTLTIVDVDTRIQKIREIGQFDGPVKYRQFYGRGGTKLMPMFENKKLILEKNPDLFIYYTDGEAMDYPKAKDVQKPLIWIFCRGENHWTKNAPYGEKIYVDMREQ